MSSDIAVSVRDLGKCYYIYNSPRDRLRHFFWRGNTRFFHEFWALQDVSFEVKRGETLGVVGENGSGKSTLLQIICNTLSATKGSYQTQGRVVALLELGAGFNPEFTGKENVFINAAILGLPREEIEKRYSKIAEFADIGEYIDQPVKTYSSGMYLRLAFAVMVHVDADIFVIDEALSVGDAFFSQKCMRFLREFQERGTIIFVSHDASAVVNLCHNAIWLDHGRMKLHGSAKEVCEAYLQGGFERRQGVSIDMPGGFDGKSDPASVIKDQRLQFINTTTSRNDLQVFSFDPAEAAFGKSGANITDVRLMDTGGNTLEWAVGGETVVVSISARAEKAIKGAIIGFYVKDRLGQSLFGDNTFITTLEKPVEVEAGEVFEARFQFNMPILPMGDYSITAAVAEGDMTDHVQHHWIHDALIFKSRSSSFHQGLVGIPMHEIKIIIR